MKNFAVIAFILALTSCSYQEDKTRLQTTSARGVNKPLVIIHDGPGLTYTYLAKWLAPLQNLRKLVFYDQLSCYHRKCSDHPVTIDDLSKQLEKVTAQYGNNYGILAHGWGSVLLMHYLSHTPKHLHPDEVILVTPMPLDWSSMMSAATKHSKNFTSKEENLLQEVKHPNQCMKALEIGVKYSVYDKKKLPDIYFDQYDCIISGYLMSNITNYDYRFFEHLLPQKTLWVTGEVDYFQLPDYIKSSSKKIIGKSGHYPFIENQEAFIQVTSDFLEEKKR